MPVKDKSFICLFFVEDTANGGGKTGDAANLTARILNGASSVTPTNGISEVDATNAEGWYQLTITAGENGGANMALAVKSSTADCFSSGARWTNEVNVDAIDGDQTAAADLEGKIDTIDSNVDAILVDTGTTLPATLSTIEGKVDTVDGVADSILVDTGTTLPATLATLATQASVDVIDGNVDAILVDTGTTIQAQITALNDPSASAIADAVWDENLSGHQGLGAAGATVSLINTQVNTMASQITIIDGVVDDIEESIHQFRWSYDGSTEGSEILYTEWPGNLGGFTPYLKPITPSGFDSDPTWDDDVVTYDLQSGPGSAPDIYAFTYANGLRKDTVYAVFLGTQGSEANTDTYWGIINTEDPTGSGGGASAEDVRAEMDSNSTQLAAIVADTNELQTDWADGGRLDLLLDAASGGSIAGPGAIEHEVTIQIDGSPVQGADVWVTSTNDINDSVVAGTLVTDAFGNATFRLDAGTYYLWVQKAGANFTNPTAFTVSA